MRNLKPLRLCFPSLMRGGISFVGILGLLATAFGHASGQDLAIGRSPLKKWAYCLIESFDSVSQRHHLEGATKHLSVLAVTGYRLGRDGQVRTPSRQSREKVSALATKNGFEVFPLVAFTSSSEGRAFLNSPEAGKRAIEELVKVARDGVNAGLHLDFEYLPPEYAPKLAGFLQELQRELNGRKLTMAIFPPVDFPAKWAGFHNLDLIGPFLDEIVLMCYDYHSPGTPAGPVVDLEWARRNITQALKSVRSENLWLGVPAYGYDWSTVGKTKVVPAREAASLAARHHAVRHPSGTLYYFYSDPRGSHEVYVADKETRRQMEDLAGSLGLKGVALWRLGFEEQ